ncbi:long-chain fatty alcohol dehydrogenase [Pseudovirgaria hyperparasitica]|uniref:Long-chain-alcohol oxidase n=1 Tax=Pseudovirgaria hyperparasitica TaxID=470096 RepID=A0A6A6VUD9_9PEZI|nr:long-chain fatty alcohol dehydrogenase [Pseudovirgaria hyperparasitica]KAF2753833.1 long-chain fatty alcohol dehydrogenase [Pseudovirgaria hyperparasitica]
MATATVTGKIPKASPPSALPSNDPLTPEQWKTFLAISDAFVPAVQPKSKADPMHQLAVPDDEYSRAMSVLERITPTETGRLLVDNYLQESPGTSEAFRKAVYRLMSFFMVPDQKNQLIMVLNVLNYRAGSLLLTGSTTPISEQPVHVREQILRGWENSRLPPLRLLMRSLQMLTKQSWIQTSPSMGPLLGYPRVPVHGTPGKGFEYSFIQMPPGDGPEIIETDVVVVGSGCGAGVSAKNVADAGYRVIVAEAGHYWPPEHLPMTEQEGQTNLFMNGGLMLSDDQSIGVAAGQTWGGGGTVNWSASLQTQSFVRKEWADSGLPYFTSAEFQADLDTVCNRMGVSTDFIQHNQTNQLLMEGARKLGYGHKAVPQNTGGKQHYCGYCTLGCASCEKQGPVISYLPDAARAGAQFIEGFHVKKVLFEDKKGGRTAVGVQGIWKSRDLNGGIEGPSTVIRDVIIKAKRVIVSGGTMQSPLLLMRSGLKNSNIGKYLHLHPVSFLGAIHEREIKPWEGGILTAVVSEYENLDGVGHGAKIEATNMLPATWLPWAAWDGGLGYKINAARMKHMVGYISIARDRDTGSVFIDPNDGRCRINYHPSAFDKKHIMEGVIACAKIQYIAGATEIFTTIPHVPKFVRNPANAGLGINDPEFVAWLATVRRAGFPSPETLFVSAHQMGTCRMGASKGTSVVDPKGKVWDTQGLYVADASVFPSASGVNPMITNMAISNYISRNVVAGLADGIRGKL